MVFVAMTWLACMTSNVSFCVSFVTLFLPSIIEMGRLICNLHSLTRQSRYLHPTYVHLACFLDAEEERRKPRPPEHQPTINWLRRPTSYFEAAKSTDFENKKITPKIILLDERWPLSSMYVYWSSGYVKFPGCRFKILQAWHWGHTTNPCKVPAGTAAYLWKTLCQSIFWQLAIYFLTLKGR